MVSNRGFPPTTAMSDENQIIIPQSFIALFLDPGRSRPNAPRELIATRYDLCEDMAGLLTTPAQAMAFDQGMAEAEVLRRCHQGLCGEDSAFSAPEAVWIVWRLAELLDWPSPELA